MRQIYRYNEEQYSSETPEFMYFLGLVASDRVLDYSMNKNSVLSEKSSNGNVYYIMQYTCGQTKKFFDIIYKNKNFYMERKYNKFLEKFANLG